MEGLLILAKKHSVYLAFLTFLNKKLTSTTYQNEIQAQKT